MAVQAEKGGHLSVLSCLHQGKEDRAQVGNEVGGGYPCVQSQSKIYIKKNIPARSIKFCENFALDLRGIIII